MKYWYGSAPVNERSACREVQLKSRANQHQSLEDRRTKPRIRIHEAAYKGVRFAYRCLLRFSIQPLRRTPAADKSAEGEASR
jgi:hypothetical protein